MRAHLQRSMPRVALPALLALVAFYDAATDPVSDSGTTLVASLVAVALAGMLIRCPRWLVYGALFAAAAVRLCVLVHVVADGPQDAASTRDAAVEVTTRSLLGGENAWNAEVAADITTGPTSILLAVPFVLVFDEINGLSFAFWLAFLGSLLVLGVTRRNDTWPVLAMFVVLGLFDIEHTAYWALEELYYPVLYLAAAYALIRMRRWPSLVGALIAAAILSRPSYLFAAVGFGIWYFGDPLSERRQMARMAIGFLAGSIVIALPFALIGGADLVDRNPWRVALTFTGGAWPETNGIFRLLNRVSGMVGPWGTRSAKLAVPILVLFLLGWRLRALGVRHPFWHVACGSLLAHTVAWMPAPEVARDYTLVFVLPAMLAVAASGDKADEPRRETGVPEEA